LAASPAVTEKKRCKLVKKTVRGKTRRVRVCTTVRPKAPAKPRNVGMTLDAGRAVTAEMPLAGGTVATSTVTGATLSLGVPGDALVAPTAITITPVRSVSAPAGVRLLAAAQFGPEGLGLAKPATLTIALPAGIPAQNVHAFGWFGVGGNVHRLPVRVSANRAEIHVTHFSGAGVAVGNPDWLARAVTALTIQYGRYIRPQIRAAETNDSLIESAFNQAFGWQKQVELLGLHDRFKTWREEVRASYARAILNALEKATDRCVDGHDLTQVGRLFSHARTIQLFGIAVPGADPLDRAVRCARFELDAEIVNRVEGSDGTYVDNHVSLKALPIAMGVGLVLSGTKGYEYVSIRHNMCSSQAAASATTPFSVTRLVVPLGARPDGAPPPREVALELEPGGAQATVFCTDMTFPVITYHSIFTNMHKDERAGSAFTIRAWEWVGGAVVARKRYDRTEPIPGGGSFREQTTLTLRHMPMR
jgi:hypothetical protein